MKASTYQATCVPLFPLLPSLLCPGPGRTDDAALYQERPHGPLVYARVWLSFHCAQAGYVLINEGEEPSTAVYCGCLPVA